MIESLDARSRIGVTQRVERDPLLDLSGLNRCDQAASKVTQHPAGLVSEEKPFPAIERINVFVRISEPVNGCETLGRIN